MQDGPDIAILTEQIRKFLNLSLPEYMIPSFFIFLDHLPVTANGKTDRKSLPNPNTIVDNRQDKYIAPETYVEKELCAIWSEVLKLDNIGIQDNFFRVGGDSIISIQLISKARQKNIYFSVRDVFEHPTIASLSRVARLHENSSVIRADQNTVIGEIPLTPIQHWFFNNKFIEQNYFNQSILLQSETKLELLLLNKVFSHLLLHHDALRMRYYKNDAAHWNQLSKEFEDNLSVLWRDLSLTSDEQLAAEIENESTTFHQTLNIETGPIIQVVLFELGNRRPQRLLIIVHHLVIDGVSWRILIEDIEHLYSLLCKKETLSLPPKSHSYQQWSKIYYANTRPLRALFKSITTGKK